jgi:hypothetical protein
LRQKWHDIAYFIAAPVVAADADYMTPHSAATSRIGPILATLFSKPQCAGRRI